MQTGSSRALQAFPTLLIQSPIKEKKHLTPGGGDRTADIFIPNFINGHNTAMDVSVRGSYYLNILQILTSGLFLNSGFCKVVYIQNLAKMEKSLDSCKKNLKSCKKNITVKEPHSQRKLSLCSAENGNSKRQQIHKIDLRYRVLWAALKLCP